HAGRLLGAAPTPGQPRRGAARLWKCASSVLLVVLVVLVSIVVLGQLSRSADLDVAAERLELEPGAARADREVEPVLGLSRQLHGEAGAEVAVEGRDGDRHVRLLWDRHPHVAVMRPEEIGRA